MSDNPTYGKTITDEDSGCEYAEVTCGDFSGKVRLCHVRVSDIKKIATELTKQVQDTSWMAGLDKGTKRSYERTVTETAAALADIFATAVATDKIASDFGELMVSIGSARALNAIFEHSLIPIAELWKPQLKQNEGFDFHTVCKNEFINFGEAKFSSTDSPHGNAINQAASFVKDEKHLRDRVHLVSLVSGEAINNLDDDAFGIVAAFSINAKNPFTVLKNALDSAMVAFPAKSIKYAYLVGVSH